MYSSCGRMGLMRTVHIKIGSHHFCLLMMDQLAIPTLSTHLVGCTNGHSLPTRRQRRWEQESLVVSIPISGCFVIKTLSILLDCMLSKDSIHHQELK